jgi:DHA1 family multidrug resistance protein-like MFS transporter
MAVNYVDHLGWAAGSVGIVLALRQLTQQGLTTFFGVLCDRIGPKPLIATGMLVLAGTRLRVAGGFGWLDVRITEGRIARCTLPARKSPAALCRDRGRLGLFSASLAGMMAVAVGIVDVGTPGDRRGLLLIGFAASKAHLSS